MSSLITVLVTISPPTACKLYQAKGVDTGVQAEDLLWYIRGTPSSAPVTERSAHAPLPHRGIPTLAGRPSRAKVLSLPKRFRNETVWV
jgi:hypothetical protein